MEMSWITAISQLYSQIINLFGNAILKLIHIRLFDLLTRCHYILNSPLKSMRCVQMLFSCLNKHDLIVIYQLREIASPVLSILSNWAISLADG